MGQGTRTHRQLRTLPRETERWWKVRPVCESRLQVPHAYSALLWDFSYKTEIKDQMKNFRTVALEPEAPSPEPGQLRWPHTPPKPALARGGASGAQVLEMIGQKHQMGRGSLKF